MRCFTWGFSLALLASTALSSLPVRAEEDDHEKNGVTYQLGALSLTATLDAGLAYFGVTNAQAGIGSNSIANTRAGGRDWIEGFLRPGLTLETALGGGTAYGGLKAVGAFTRGDGDAQATSGTSDKPEKLALEDLVIGWRSGDTFARLGEDAVDVSIGNQSFAIGDGFLLVDGTVDGSRRSAYVVGPRSAFEKTAILRLNTDPVRADLFQLQGNVDQRLMRGGDLAAAKLVGANVEWFASSHKDHGRSEYDERLWYVGGTVLHFYDSDSSGNFSFANGGGGNQASSNRDGLNVYSLRVGGKPFGGLAEALTDFGLYGEFAMQRNDSALRRVRADAWYIEPQYTFSALPWSPRLSYRHAHFSGDGDTADQTDKSWDSLYSGGGPRGIGTWDLGEIYARYVGGNSNLNTDIVHLRLQPLEELAVGAIYYRHRYDEPAQTAGVNTKDLLNEVNVYAEWETPVKGLTLVGLLGAARPGDGLKQALGTNDRNDRTIHLGQVILGYSF